MTSPGDHAYPPGSSPKGTHPFSGLEFFPSFPLLMF
jgi:hypothetical protein